MTKQNKLTPEDAQQLMNDLMEIVINQDPRSSSLLEVIIDQYLYSITDDEVEELRGIMSKEFGYD
jgi:DNA-directed RNA polymerase subunit F